LLYAQIATLHLGLIYIHSFCQLGERLFTRQDVRPYFEAGCIDIIQPDLAHAGGLSEVKKIATMAE
jgi:L-alanine-DL-glutamate epimerase-like enolase superfamily enzyme